MSYYPSINMVRWHAENRAKQLLPRLQEIPHKAFDFQFSDNRWGEVIVTLRHKHKDDPFFIKVIVFTIQWATYWENVAEMERLIEESIAFWWDRFHSGKTKSDFIGHEHHLATDVPLKSVEKYATEEGNKLLDALNKACSNYKFDFTLEKKWWGCICQYLCPALASSIAKLGYFFIAGEYSEVHDMRAYMENVISKNTCTPATCWYSYFNFFLLGFT